MSSRSEKNAGSENKRGATMSRSGLCSCDDAAMTLSYDDAIAIVERRAEFANLPEKDKHRQAVYYLGCDLADDLDFLNAIKLEDGSPHKTRWLKECRDVTEMLDKALHEWSMTDCIGAD